MSNGCVSTCTLILASLVTPNIRADAIDFEQFHGPSLFVNAGTAQTLTIPTSIGDVLVSGGVVLSNEANLPVDESSVYSTAGNTASLGIPDRLGFTNPLTVTFPVPITNFFLDVLNGNIINVSYTLSDNTGNSATFALVPNLSSGQKTIGFAASGTVVTIAATSGQSSSAGLLWDFGVDNIHFNEALPPDLPNSASPEPASLFSIGVGMAGLLAFSYRAKLRRK